MPSTAVAAVELSEEMVVVAVEVVVVTASAAVEDKDCGVGEEAVVVSVVELGRSADGASTVDVVEDVAVDSNVVEVRVEMREDVEDDDAGEGDDVFDGSGPRAQHLKNILVNILN